MWVSNSGVKFDIVSGRKSSTAICNDFISTLKGGQAFGIALPNFDSHDCLDVYSELVTPQGKMNLYSVIPLAFEINKTINYCDVSIGQFHATLSDKSYNTWYIGLNDKTLCSDGSNNCKFNAGSNKVVWKNSHRETHCYWQVG